jgi:uncharacterized BrkB/YihY/UPF0761 family membrane protein
MLMNKILAVLIALSAIAITLCIYVSISAASTLGAHALLPFVEDHPAALRGVTFFVTLTSILFVIIKRRNRK